MYMFHGFSYDLAHLFCHIDNGLCSIRILYSFSITKRYNGIYFEHYQKQFQVILKNKENERREEHTSLRAKVHAVKTNQRHI